ncbi:hypothetical protein Dimus_024115 [Dionaea muscipula]
MEGITNFLEQKTASEQEFCVEVYDKDGSMIDGRTIATCDDAMDFSSDTRVESKTVAATVTEVDLDSEIEKGVHHVFDSQPDTECRVSRMCFSEAECKSWSNQCLLDPLAESLKNLGSCGRVGLGNSSGDGQICSEVLLSVTAQSVSSPDVESSYDRSSGDPSVMRDVEDMKEKPGALYGLEDKLCSEVLHSPVNQTCINFTSSYVSQSYERRKSDFECEIGLLEETDVKTFGPYDIYSATNVAATEGSLADVENKVQEGSPTVDPNLVVGKTIKETATLQPNAAAFGIFLGITNSSSVDDVPCHVPDEEYARVRDASEEKFLCLQSTSLRRSSRANKYVQKAGKNVAVRKCSTKPSNTPYSDGVVDLFLKIPRRKRSCSRKSIHSSGWGLPMKLSQYFEHDCGATKQEIPNQNSIKLKGVQSSRKQKMSQASTSLRGSKSKRSVPPGTIRLKVIFGKRTDQNTLQVKSSLGLENCSSAGDKVFSRDNMFDSSLSYMKVENSKDTCVRKKDVDTTIISNDTVHNLCKSTSRMAPGKSCYNCEISLDPGTSPDSEVINNAPDSQTGPMAVEVLNSAVDSFDSIPNSKVLDSSSKTRKKSNMKHKVSQTNKVHVEDSVKCHASKSKTNGSKKSREPQTRESRNSLELHPLNEAQQHKISNVSKSMGKNRNKCKINDTAIAQVENSHRWKWGNKKLASKAIVKNYLYDEACKKDDAETGKDVMDDEAISNTDSGVTCGEPSSKAIVPCGDSGGLQRLRPRNAWVCCDDCDKWRCIPAALVDAIEKTNCRWTCKDNHDKAFADCSIPQEMSNAEINAALEALDEEDAYGTHLGSEAYGSNHTTGHQQSSWMHINSNLFLHRRRKTQTMDEVMVCHCRPPRDGRLGCRDECLNRMLNIECIRGTCPCGDFCSNQQFQKRKYAQLRLFRSGKKGHGLQVLEDISQGQFIIEYVGEVLDLPTYEARQRDYASIGHKHFYFMTLNGNEVIDACAKGNLGRYINHSCEPNCRTEKWMVNGEICIGLFAIRNIDKGQELTFDYNYVRVFGAAAKKCYCGAAQCRGYIGGDLLNTEVIVHGDSDDEYPDPVVVYENGEIQNGLENINALSSSMDVEQVGTADVLPEQASLNLSEDKDMVVEEGKTVIAVGEQLVMGPDKDSNKGSLVDCSNIDDSLGKLEALRTDDVSEKSLLQHQQETPSESKEMIDPSSSIQRSDSSSENRRLRKCLPQISKADSVGYGLEVAEGKHVQSKSRLRMKNSHSSKCMNNHKSTSNATNDHKAFKPKKQLEASASCKLEAVEEKLNDLLDVDGGICKRKDASRGYLKLLLLTAASGDNGNGGTIQSNRDLSMILDAMLKTKSRGVLVDIINKNGLQMLHNMMKQYRRDFNKIPILRKLLKVLEYLAEKEILTGERINANPRCLGVESLRESVLVLTEHQDKKIHQIARGFRDKWIPRVRKISCVDKGDRKVEGNRFTGSHHRWHDNEVRPSEAIDCTKLAVQLHKSFAARMEEGSSFQVGSCVATVSGTRKRKSRWDQPSDSEFPCQGQKALPILCQNFDSSLHPETVKVRLRHINRARHVEKSSTDCSDEQTEYCTTDNGVMGPQGDAPPGFSSHFSPGFSSLPPPPPGFSSLFVVPIFSHLLAQL